VTDAIQVLQCDHGPWTVSLVNPDGVEVHSFGVMSRPAAEMLAETLREWMESFHEKHSHEATAS